MSGNCVIVFVFCAFNPLHQVYILLVILSDSCEVEYHNELVCHLKYKLTTVSLWCVATSEENSFSECLAPCNLN